MSDLRLPQAPYKGLARFDDSALDERFFFGRDREIDLVAANLVASRLTVLYGPSGVGKSSLLRAGVVRRLRALVPAGTDGDGDGALPVVVDQWRDDPVAAIAAAAGARTPQSPEELAEVLAERSGEVDGEIYLVLDQVEEYFVYHGRDRGGPLRDALAEILAEPGLRVHVLLGIRDDALADLDAFKGRVPSLFGNVLRLDHLDVHAARAAILEPLAELEALGGPHVEAEPALVAAVVDQVASGRIERRLAGRGIVAGAAKRGRVEAPYLQLVMERLWDVERERGSSVLRATTLAELGGAGRIVQQHLERALASFAAPDRELVARLFHQLVTPSGTKIAHAVGDLSRYAGATPERLEEVLRELSAERVVRAVPARNGGGARYEIFHDVLADAVLAWGARHEAERALAEEREAARRRHRRLAVIIGFGAVALTAMALLTAYAFEQRSDARGEATAAEGRELLARAVSVLEVDPELSLRLALRSASHERTPALQDALRNGVKSLRMSRVLPGGGGPVVATSMSGNGTLILVATSSGRARIFDLASGKLVSEVHHGAEVADAVLAPDAKWFVTGGADGVARRWETQTGVPLQSFDANAAIRSLAVSPDGSRLATAAGNVAAVWEAEGGGRVRALRHPKRVDAVSFDPAGRALLTIASDARVFDTRTWRQDALLDQPGQILVGAFSASGTFVVTGGRDDVAAVWDWRAGMIRHTLEGHASDVVAVAWSPASDLVATSSSDSTARVWRVANGELASLLAGHSNLVNGIVFSPDGASIATSSLDGSARVWGEGEPFARSAALLGHVGALSVVSFTPDGRSVVTGSDDGSVRVWRSSVDPVAEVVARNPAPGRAVAFAPDGTIISIGQDGTMLLAGPGGRQVRSIQTRVPIVDAAVFGDGKRVLTAGVDGTARLFAPDGRLVRQFVHGAGLRAVTVGSAGGRVATAGADGFGRVWDVASGRQLRAFRHGGVVTGITFSPDGTRIATAGDDAEGRVWRLADGRLLGKLHGHENALTSIAFSPSGRRLVTASYDADARLWDASTFELQRLLRGHASVISDAVFSPDGRWIATAGPTTIGLWETATARRIEAPTPVLYVRGHGPRVRSVAFAPGSRRIASTGDDGSVRTYLCELCGTGDELVQLARRRLEQLGANLTAEERRRYLGG